MNVKTSNSDKKKLPTVVLAGRPNVGKSTLFNRLTRSRKALVDPTPGLTRDIRRETVRYEGYEFELVDTGGLFDIVDLDPLGNITHEHSMTTIMEADLLLILFDARVGLTAFDHQVANELRKTGIDILFVVNKVDDPQKEVLATEFYDIGADNLISISAEHNLGIDELMDVVIERLKEKSCFSASNTNEEETEDNEEAIRVTILGRPNTGKSSLINTILGQPRMIVTDIAGTTRDAIDTLVRGVTDLPIIFTDTAGIRRKSRVRKRIEKFSVIKAIDSLKDCDIALVLMDASQGITEQDKRLLGYAQKADKAIIAAFNKWDLVKGDPDLPKRRSQEIKDATRFMPYACHAFISAKTGKGVKRIFQLITDIYKQYSATISTPILNQVLRHAISTRMPPISKGHHLRLFYVTQVATKPPTFLIFVNYPDVVPNTYKRFLGNQFRKHLSLENTPIKLLFRERS